MIDGTLEPAYASLASRFERLFTRPRDGGGALCMYVDGVKVVDVWSGWKDPAAGERWQADTVAMSFSTTKGVASTVVHTLVDEGVLSYDEPVATWWPEFAAHGKHNITLREVMSHRAGLHDVRALVDAPGVLLDHHEMEDRLAAARPKRHPEGRSGYHGFTYGWLVGGIVRRATGTPLTEHVAKRIADPLDLDGLFIGLPPDQRHRNAPLSEMPEVMSAAVLGARLEKRRSLRGIAQALLPNHVEGILRGGDELMETEMASVNGFFDARSLARMYATISLGGTMDGVTLMSRRTVDAASRKHAHGRDYVIGIPMGWRLGYHQAFTTGRPPRRGFGHFGFGGAGAWCDLDRRVSLAFVTNRMASLTTPFADARLARLGGHALKLVEQVTGRGRGA